MPSIIITVESDDTSDIDWLYTRVVGPVEDAVSEARDEGRLDGTVTVSVERDDD